MPNFDPVVADLEPKHWSLGIALEVTLQEFVVFNEFGLFLQFLFIEYLVHFLEENQMKNKLFLSNTLKNTFSFVVYIKNVFSFDVTIRVFVEEYQISVVVRVLRRFCNCSRIEFSNDTKAIPLFQICFDLK